MNTECAGLEELFVAVVVIWITQETATTKGPFFSESNRHACLLSDGDIAECQSVLL